MQMLNPYCGVDRDSRGVVRLDLQCRLAQHSRIGRDQRVREGLEVLATERQIRVLVIAGQSERA